MKKFVVMYRVPVEVMQEWQKNTPPEEMKAQGMKLGQDMAAWSQKNEKSIIDKGLPLGKNTRMTKEGATQVSNDLNYYCVVEAESIDAVVTMFSDNPHILTIPSSFLDIMEVSHMAM
ncbi:MAG: hypothetical protein JWM46_40 [Candidatus Kaiserbacteria bacterium]|nr:hypothetical protein [Candidatus Kaiserbacteria bacterium]